MIFSDAAGSLVRCVWRRRGESWLVVVRRLRLCALRARVRRAAARPLVLGTTARRVSETWGGRCLLQPSYSFVQER